MTTRIISVKILGTDSFRAETTFGNIIRLRLGVTIDGAHGGVLVVEANDSEDRSAVAKRAIHRLRDFCLGYAEPNDTFEIGVEPIPSTVRFDSWIVDVHREMVLEVSPPPVQHQKPSPGRIVHLLEAITEGDDEAQPIAAIITLVRSQDRIDVTAFHAGHGPSPLPDVPLFATREAATTMFYKHGVVAFWPAR